MTRFRKLVRALKDSYKHNPLLEKAIEVLQSDDIEMDSFARANPNQTDDIMSIYNYVRNSLTYEIDNYKFFANIKKYSDNINIYQDIKEDLKIGDINDLFHNNAQRSITNDQDEFKEKLKESVHYSLILVLDFNYLLQI